MSHPTNPYNLVQKAFCSSKSWIFPKPIERNLVSGVFDWRALVCTGIFRVVRLVPASADFTGDAIIWSKKPQRGSSESIWALCSLFYSTSSGPSGSIWTETNRSTITSTKPLLILPVGNLNSRWQPEILLVERRTIDDERQAAIGLMCCATRAVSSRGCRK